MNLNHLIYLNNDGDEAVYFFVTPQESLSNWSAHTVRLWGKRFPTAEHAFQYQKFLAVDPAWAEKIRHAPSPWAAKCLSRERSIVPKTWDARRVEVMQEILTEKVRQHPDVKQRLLETGDRAIVECTPNDTFWGYGTEGTGQNILGKLWIKLRSECNTRPQ